MCFKKSVLYVTVISICGICSYPMLASKGAFSEKLSDGNCETLFSTEKKYSEFTNNIVQECLNLHPLKNPNESGSVEESEQILEENQSNCALKCINENLNVTTENGSIDISRIQEVFLRGSNATESYILKLTSMMSECERTAGKKVQYEGGFENNTCKYHVLFMHCYSDAYVESREEFMKLCRESDESASANPN